MGFWMTSTGNDAANDGNDGLPVRRIEETLHEIFDEIETRRVNSLSTGFRELDYLTNGFARGQMVVIGSRPGIGKSAFVANIAEHVAAFPLFMSHSKR